MSGQVFLYDHPSDAARFLPFTLARPIPELRHGAHLIRERISSALGRDVFALVAAVHLAEFAEEGAPPVVPSPHGEGIRVFLRSTFLPARGTALPDAGKEPIRLVDGDGATVGAVLPDGVAWPGADAISESWPSEAVSGERLEGSWQLVERLGTVLRSDLDVMLAEAPAGVVPAGTAVLGDPSLLVTEGAAVEPNTVFDVRGGPIHLSPGVEVRSFTRLAGPLAVGPGTRLVGGQIRESSIGPMCVVHGEVTNTVFVGYSNKAHEGFLGHSVVGRWVNLGAATNNSNLKNTYGPVRLDLGAERIETGMMFLGALIGDHAKTAIGTMLPTGCVVGVGANLFGTTRPRNVVAPFAWGTEEPDRVLACRMFLRTAERVLPRRGATVDDATRRYLSAVWQAGTWRPCS